MVAESGRRLARAGAAVLAVAAVWLGAGCSADGVSEGGRPPGAAGSATHSDGRGPAGAAPRGSALEAVDRLTVKGRAPKTGYSREEFGGGWADTDGNGCPTREDILKRDLTEETFLGATGRDGGNDGCRVAHGVLHDPYTGRRTTFLRGSSEIDIDHVVALSDAWQKGAQQWPRHRRVAFANDPLNLLAADARANRAKGDGDTATWLPPDKSFRCPYVARQVAVKLAYGLWVTRAEKRAMVRVLSGCPRERLPARTAPAPARPTQTGAPDAEGGPVVYRNCDAVRAAGKAPIRRGQSGYGRHLDRDGDGTGCDS